LLLQALLNTRAKPALKLLVDGIFGPRTEATVRQYQGVKGLKVDGIVGRQTWGALRGKAGPAAKRHTHPGPAARKTPGPMPAPRQSMMQTTAETPPPVPANVKKFVGELGTVSEFVDIVRGLERQFQRDPYYRLRVMQGLFKNGTSAAGNRYLIVRINSGPGVLDMPHFFTIASLSYSKSTQPLGTGGGIEIGGTPGKAILMGVANEMVQCVTEATAMELNSCFSKEDLASNRLGMRFAEKVLYLEKSNGRIPVSDLLDQFLNSLDPAPPSAIRQVKLQSNSDVLREAATAIVLGGFDLVVPAD
jgi:hypothetical protein